MKKTFPGPFRSKNFNGRNGTYVTVYQRPNEPPRLDLNFFDGDCTVEHAESLHLALESAIAQAKNWGKE